MEPGVAVWTEGMKIQVEERRSRSSQGHFLLMSVIALRSAARSDVLLVPGSRTASTIVGQNGGPHFRAKLNEERKQIYHSKQRGNKD